MNKIDIIRILKYEPSAIAKVSGSRQYPDVKGTVRFYQTAVGVVVAADIYGLPESNEACGGAIFAFHIHEGGSCSENGTEPFPNSMSHYNPHNCPHPYHAGDMPPLFGSNGIAYSVFLTNRFSVREIMGKTVIIHMGPDDFTTQPSGNSGSKIACGVIM